jgi:hypothetical protein
MSVYYDQIDILINGTGILAENANLQTDASINPLFLLGYRDNVNQVPNGPITSKISLNYILEINSEPTKNIVNSIKNIHNDLIYSPIILNFAGVSGSYYLQSFGFSANPNSLIRANAQFISFDRLSGNLLKSVNSVNYNTTKFSGIGHGWTVYISSLQNKLPTYSFDYNFEVNWQPIYTIGQKYPIQVQLQTCKENMKFVRDVFEQVDFSGRKGEDYISSGNINDTIKISGLLAIISGNNYGFEIGITGGKVKNYEMSADPDNIIRIITEINKYY